MVFSIIPMLQLPLPIFSEHPAYPCWNGTPRLCTAFSLHMKRSPKAHRLISRTAEVAVAWWSPRFPILPLGIIFPKMRVEITHGLWHIHVKSSTELNNSFDRCWWPSRDLFQVRFTLSLTMHPDLSIDQKSSLFISNENPIIAPNYSKGVTTKMLLSVQCGLISKQFPTCC